MKTEPPELLTELRAVMSNADVDFAVPLTVIPGGNETTIYRFTLSGVPEGSTWGRELILRVFDASGEKVPTQPRVEAVVQRFLMAQGFPVPDVLHVHDESPAWLVMSRLTGSPLGSEALDFPMGLLRIPALTRLLVETMTRLREQLHAIDAAALRSWAAEGGVTVPGLEYWIRRARLRADAMGGSMARAMDYFEEALSPWSDTRPHVICHCDLHPLNILMNGARVSGVIDWGGVTIAPREFDIANSVAVMSLVSVTGPPVLRQFVEAALRRIARRYLAAAGRVDRAKVDEIVAFRALVEIIPILERGYEEGHFGQWNVALLRRTVADVTGIRVP